MSPSAQFNEAVDRVKTLTVRPTNDQLLTLYGFYKQATEGDVQEARPTGWDFKAMAKYDAWAKLKGMSSLDAEAQYIALVDEMVK